MLLLGRASALPVFFLVLLSLSRSHVGGWSLLLFFAMGHGRHAEVRESLGGVA